MDGEAGSFEQVVVLIGGKSSVLTIGLKLQLQVCRIYRSRNMYRRMLACWKQIWADECDKLRVMPFLLIPITA